MPNVDTSTTPVSSAPATESGIRQRAAELLARHSYRAVRDVECEHEDGALILKGQLPTYHMKQMAQAAVTELFAVVRIDNRIEVPERAQPLTAE